MKQSAFTGWQFYTLLDGMLGGNKDKKSMNYMEYSERLGLLSDQEKEHLALFKQMEKIRQKQEAKDAINRAANIVEMDRASRKKGG